MRLEKQPQTGLGKFQWSVGAWFGSVAGSTAWMLVTAGFLLAHQQGYVACIPISCFTITNLVALLLWSRRKQLDPFFAFIIQLAVIAVTMPTAWIAVACWGSPAALAQMSWPSHPIWNYVVLFMAPAAMLWFWYVERQSRNAESDKAGTTIETP